MNWYLSCAYQPEQKRCFHSTARARLRKLAATLDFAPDTSTCETTKPDSRKRRDLHDPSFFARVVFVSVRVPL